MKNQRGEIKYISPLSYKFDDHSNHPQYIEDLSCACWVSQILFSAIDLEIFTLVSKGNNSSSALSQLTNTDRNSLDRFLNTLCSLGLLYKEGKNFYNSLISDKHLVKGKDSYLGKSDSYRGEKIVYVRELSSGKRGKVQTNFFTTDQKKVVVDFNMHKVNGTWKVYDIIYGKFLAGLNVEKGTFAPQKFDLWLDIKTGKGAHVRKFWFYNCRISDIGEMVLNSSDDTDGVNALTLTFTFDYMSYEK